MLGSNRTFQPVSDSHLSLPQKDTLARTGSVSPVNGSSISMPVVRLIAGDIDAN